jgi:hypothetical protein
LVTIRVSSLKPLGRTAALNARLRHRMALKPTMSCLLLEASSEHPLKVVVALLLDLLFLEPDHHPAVPERMSVTWGAC